MKRVNLIPKDVRYGVLYKAYLYAGLHIIQVSVGVIIFFLIAASMTSIMQSILIVNSRKEVAKAEKTLDVARVKGKSLADLSMQYKRMATYLSYANTLVGQQMNQLKAQKENWGSWALTFVELRNLMPRRLWLYRVDIVDERLQIEGGAFSEQAVTTFMSGLRGSTAFSDVQFNYTETASIGAAEVINFKINCMYDTRAVIR